jgi:HKD family nuclease
MKTSFLSTEGNALVDALNLSISEAEELFFVSAFGSDGGMSLIQSEFDRLMCRGGAARFIFDISQGMTSPTLIENIATYPGEARVKICTRDTSGRFLHSKLYLFRGENTNQLICGSNNFSMGGLVSNHEIALKLNDVDEDIWKSSSDYAQKIWNSSFSIDPVLHPEIFKKYCELHDQRKKFDFSENFSNEIFELSEIIKEINDLNSIDTQSVDTIYFIGALAANIKYQKLKEANAGKFYFKFRSQKLNSGNEDEGYITNVVDGVRLGDIKLAQFSTLRKWAQRLARFIEEYSKVFDQNAEISIEDKTEKSVNVQFSLQFSKPNRLWQVLLDYTMMCLHSSGEEYSTQLPKSIKNLSPELSIQFFQGYMDFRARLSDSDRAGTQGKLRIGVQVDKNSHKFLYEAQKYLENAHGFEVNVNNGAARGKDNLLRITADKNTWKLFRSTWQRQIDKTFADFNLSLHS